MSETNNHRMGVTVLIFTHPDAVDTVENVVYGSVAYDRVTALRAEQGWTLIQEFGATVEFQ